MTDTIDPRETLDPNDILQAYEEVCRVIDTKQLAPLTHQLAAALRETLEQLAYAEALSTAIPWMAVGFRSLRDGSRCALIDAADWAKIVAAHEAWRCRKS